jgi:hypothetical protein
MNRGGACRYNALIRSKLQSSERTSILDAYPSNLPSRLVPASMRGAAGRSAIPGTTRD